MDSSYSLEATLLQSTRHCQVWIFDPSKGEDARHYIPRLLRHRAHFGKLALGAADKKTCAYPLPFFQSMPL